MFAPLSDYDVIADAGLAAEKALRASCKKAVADCMAGGEARKALNPNFAQLFPGFLSNQGLGMGSSINSFMSQVQAALSDLGKNLTLGSPVSTGLVPFDLLAPSRLLYPVYSPFRNKFPRTAGQGTARQFIPVTAVSGSGGFGASTGGPVRITMSELNGASNLGTYPISLPSAGTQTSPGKISISYQFMGMSEQLSMLAQWAGQGFEDISALANLILMQEFMMGEEYQIASGTATALSQPAAPTVVVRTAGSNETALAAAGAGDNYYVTVTALNYYGETAYAAGSVSAAAVGTSTTSVIDVTIAPIRGAYGYRVYVSSAGASSNPGRTSLFRCAAYQGGTKFTIQGTLPTSVSPPAADSGTSSSTDYEGLMSVLDGHASVDASVYPSGYLGGYVNKNIGQKLKASVIEDALSAMWSSTTVTGDTGSTQKFRADPAELICEGTDARRLADDILQKGGTTNYTLYLQQSDVPGVRAGMAVSEFQNPSTRNVVRILVHPFLAQGTAFLMSYQLPIPNSNVSNVVENVMCQDYLSIAWPVIDIAYRYSLLAYGALVVYAPMYCGVLGGLQVSDTTPYV